MTNLFKKMYDNSFYPYQWDEKENRSKLAGIKYPDENHDENGNMIFRYPDKDLVNKITETGKQCIRNFGI